LASGTATTPRKSTVRRPPLPRGTVAIGAGATAGTLLAVIGFGAGAMALVATGAGAVLIPLAIWARRSGSRSQRRRTARQAGQQADQGVSNLLGSLLGGNGNRRGAGGGGGGPLGRGSSTGGGRGRGGGWGPAGSGGGRRRSGAGSGGLTGGGARKAGLGGVGGRGSKAGLLGMGRSGKAGKGGWGPGAGHGRGIGQHRGRGKGAVHGRGTGGGWNPVAATGRMTRATGRGLGRAGTRANGAGYQAGGAIRRGFRQPTAGGAFKKAYRRYGKKQHHKPTVTGVVGRVLGGLGAGASASLARAAWNAAKKLGRSIKNSYVLPLPEAAQALTPATRSWGQPAGQAQPGQPPQHPVPAPAFGPEAAPPATTVPAGAGQPASTKQPVTAGQPAGASGASHTYGGNHQMSSFFPAEGHALDFQNACQKWAPPRVEGGIWHFQGSLTGFNYGLWAFANGIAAFSAQAERHLSGGLKPDMRTALAEVYRPARQAALASDKLQTIFNRVYAEDIARRQIRGGEVLNV
jgi:hypothetical protein